MRWNYHDKSKHFHREPLKNGSTAILGEEARRGLKEQGVETEFVFSNDLKFRGCQACYYCKKNDVAACAVKDDMQKDSPADTGIRWAYRRHAYLLCRGHCPDKSMARPALSVYRHELEPETAGIKESLIHLHTEPAGCAALRDPHCHIHADGRVDRGVSEGSSLGLWPWRRNQTVCDREKGVHGEDIPDRKGAAGLRTGPKILPGASEIINFM